MSDPAYRDARAAASARVTALEEDLRKRKDLAAKMAALLAPHTAEKKTIRRRIGAFKNLRYFGIASSVVVIALFFGVMYAMSSFTAIAATGAVYLALIITAAWIKFAWDLRDPTLEELRGSQRLSKISLDDSRTEKRYRVASDQLRVQAHLDPVEIEALERELEEARALSGEKNEPTN